MRCPFELGIRGYAHTRNRLARFQGKPKNIRFEKVVLDAFPYAVSSEGTVPVVGP